MRDPARINPIIELLRVYWQENPDLRLGQIVSNLAPAALENDVYFLPDELLEEALRKGGR